MRIGLIIPAWCLGVAGWGGVIPVHLDQNDFRLSYEVLTLPQNEEMGLTGVHYLHRFDPNWYGGIGIYGAASGQRGGFFTGGFELGGRYPITSSIEAEAGIFVGGGGGGSAPQGGGLMVRPHIGIGYGERDWRVGVQLSRIEFPNGDIGSTQIAGVIDIPFETFRLDGSYRGSLSSLAYESETYMNRTLSPMMGKFALETQRYDPDRGVRNTDGTLTKAFSTVGVRYENDFAKNTSWHVTTAGAIGGEADGYMEFFGGVGWRYPVFETPRSYSRLYMGAEGSLGMAGGGRIATGGGSMGKLSASVSYLISPQWSMDARAGYMVPIEGDFRSRYVSLSLNHPFITVAPSTSKSGDYGYAETIFRRDWRIRPIGEYYISAQRKSSADEGVGLLGMQIDGIASEGWYLYAKATGAITGDAGGYVAGSMGGGLSYPLSASSELFAQIGGGAAGGGGIDVGGGLIAEAQTGIRFALSENLSMFASGGIVRALDGGLNTPTLSGGIAYRFGTFGARRNRYE